MEESKSSFSTEEGEYVFKLDEEESVQESGPRKNAPNGHRNQSQMKDEVQTKKENKSKKKEEVQTTKIPSIHITFPSPDETPLKKSSKNENLEQSNNLSSNEGNEEQKNENVELLGLTTEQAKRKLQLALLSTLNEETRPWLKNACYEYCFSVKFILGLVSVVLILVSLGFLSNEEKKLYPIRLLVEPIILVIIIIVNLLVHLNVRHEENTYLVRKVKAHLKKSNIDHDALLPASPSCFIWTLRDGQWQKLPLNLIVEGDIVGLLSTQNVTPPIKMKCVEPEFYGIKVDGNESLDKIPLFEKKQSLDSISSYSPNSFPTVTIGERFRFSSLETPAVHQLKSSLNRKKLYSSPIERIYKNVNFFTSLILFISIIFSLIVNGIRWGILYNSNLDNIMNMWLLRQAYLTFPLLYLSFLWIFMICIVFGNARLYTLFETLQEKDKDSPSFELDEETKLNPSEYISIKRTKEYFFKLLFSSNPTLSFASRMVYILGNVTVVLFLNKQGILTEPSLYGEKVFFLNELGTSLSLSRVPEKKKTALQFDNQEWKSFESSLKPIGLNCILNKTCSVKVSDNSQTRKLLWSKELEDPLDSHSQCLCLIGKEIGFLEDSVENFKKIQQINTFIHKSIKDISVPSTYTISLILEDQTTEERELQLLSRGDLEPILDNCDSYWNGESVEFLTNEEKTKCFSIYKEWVSSGDRTCVALSYRPVEEKYRYLFPKDEFQFPVTIHLLKKDTSFADELKEVNSMENESLYSPIDPNLGWISPPKSGKNSKIKSMKNPKDLAAIQDPKDLAAIQDIQSKQIFIGMIALKELPKLDIPRMIESFSHAGIRFVYFSSEDEIKTKTLGAKLGLETDFNCCISLQAGDNRKNCSNIAPLPRGIEEIRKHLADDIDNVPFLVKLFCDATPENSTEMIKLFQQYGEVVCCVGNGFNLENTPVFAQCDLSIGMEPLPKDCLNVHEEVSYPHFSSANFDIHESTKSLSCDLTCLTCEFVIHRNASSPEILHLFSEGRHILANIRHCMEFNFFNLLFYHFSLFLSYILFGSPILLLNGIQLLWLICIILPLMSLPFMLIPPEHRLMETIPSKNLFVKILLRRKIFELSCKLIPAILMILLIFLLSLHSTWENSDWKVLFTIIQESDYLSSNFQAALVTSQNVTLFAFIWFMGFSSLSYSYGKQSLISKPIRLNGVHLFFILLCIILEVVYFIIYLTTVEFVLNKLTWYVYLLIFLWPFVMLIIEEFVKKTERSWFKAYQTELRLEFETRLGRYSPK